MCVYLLAAKSVSEKYTLLSDFQENDIGFLNWIRTNHTLSEFAHHLILDTTLNNFRKVKWDLESSHKSAQKYNIREDFKKNDKGAYQWAKNNHLLEFITSHMQKRFTDWSFEKIHTLALSCGSRYEFEKKYKAAYIYAGRHNILDQVCSHMEIAKNGFDNSKEGMLYYIKLKKGPKFLYKVGITNFTVDERFKKEVLEIEIVKTIKFKIGREARELETKILKDNKKFLYKGRKILRSGNTELFNFDVMGWDNV